MNVTTNKMELQSALVKMRLKQSGQSAAYIQDQVTILKSKSAINQIDKFLGQIDADSDSSEDQQLPPKQEES